VTEYEPAELNSRRPSEEAPANEPAVAITKTQFYQTFLSLSCKENTFDVPQLVQIGGLQSCTAITDVKFRANFNPA
jgi:hypothetical protein